MNSSLASIHPLAIAVGVFGLILLAILAFVSSQQREKLQYMARKAFRKKRVEATTGHQDALGALPSFAKTAAETGNGRMLQRWVNSNGVDIDARSNENLSALHYAARGGHSECMR